MVPSRRKIDLLRLRPASVILLFMTIINSNPSSQRQPLVEETLDQCVSPDDYFGVTSEKGNQIWHFDGVKAVRLGAIDPDERSMVVLKDGESLRAAMQRIPVCSDNKFVIHRMELPPGGYFPRMARPEANHSGESLGALPNIGEETFTLTSALNSMRSLVGALDLIFRTVHPVDANMKCFGDSIRNLLILACTECEAHWRGILAANNALPKDPRTRHFIKLKKAMRLDEFAVKLHQYPWLGSFRPFAGWNVDFPTKSLLWYDDYNASKHSREIEFHRSTINSAINSVIAVWILIVAQFGYDGIRKFRDLSEYFHLEFVPLWRFSEVYIPHYDGYVRVVSRVDYPFD